MVPDVLWITIELQINPTVHVPREKQVPSLNFSYLKWKRKQLDTSHEVKDNSIKLPQLNMSIKHYINNKRFHVICVTRKKKLLGSSAKF